MAGNFYKPITIGTASIQLSDYQIKLVVNFVDGHMNSDFSDLGFETLDGTKLSFWIETKTDGVSAIVWVKIPSTSTTSTQTIKMTYGNVGATSESNGENTFVFFDNFTGSAIDTNKWQITNSTGFSVSGGELIGTNSTGRIRLINTFAPPLAYETKWRYTADASNGFMLGGVFISTADAFGVLNHPSTDYYRLNSNWINWASNKVAGSTNYLAYLRATATNSAIVGIENYSTLATQNTSGVQSFDITNKPFTLGYRYDDQLTGQGYTCYWDWVIARKYLNTAPTITIGSELPLFTTNYLRNYRRSRITGSITGINA